MVDVVTSANNNKTIRRTIKLFKRSKKSNCQELQPQWPQLYKFPYCDLPSIDFWLFRGCLDSHAGIGCWASPMVHRCGPKVTLWASLLFFEVSFLVRPNIGPFRPILPSRWRQIWRTKNRSRQPTTSKLPTTKAQCYRSTKVYIIYYILCTYIGQV